MRGSSAPHRRLIVSYVGWPGRTDDPAEAAASSPFASPPVSPAARRAAALAEAEAEAEAAGTPRSAAAAEEPDLAALQEEVDGSVKAAHGVAALRLVRASGVVAPRAAALRRRYEGCRGGLHDGALCLRLYYAAPKAQLEAILEAGFDAAPPEPNGLHVFGRGWYFTRYASRAHHFSGGEGCVLLALVAVGNTETVVKRDERRGAPSAGFDSVIVPGRQLPSTVGQLPSGRAGGGSFGEDYVIFDGSQALPLYLLEYEAMPL